MHAKLALSAIVAGLAAIVTSTPLDLTERQDGGAGTDAPGGPPAAGPGNCFIARAVRGNADVIGEWMEAHIVGHVRFDQNPKQADIFVLDNNGQLRLARNPASVASRDEFDHKGVGPLQMHQKLQKKEDPTFCSIDGGLLHCWTKPGDEMFTHQDELWVGTLPSLAARHIDVTPVTVAVFSIPCPAGPRPWESWQ